MVRLHFAKNANNSAKAIFTNKVYREIQTASHFASDNIVRYYNSWFEKLTPEEEKFEQEYTMRYGRILKKLKSRRAAQLGDRKSISHGRSS